MAKKKQKVVKLSKEWLENWDEKHKAHDEAKKSYTEICISVDKLKIAKSSWFTAYNQALDELQALLNALEDEYGTNSELNLEDGTITATYDFKKSQETDK